MALLDELKLYARQASQRFGVPFSTLDTVLTKESNYNPYAVNNTSSASGIGQVLAGTARDPGYGVTPLTDRFDPFKSIDFTSQYLRAMYDRTGDWGDAALAYRRGLGYALTNRGETAYAGMATVATDGGLVSPTAQASLKMVAQADAVESASWFGCEGITTPVACFQELAARGGLVLLGLLLVGLAVWAILRDSGYMPSLGRSR